MAGNFLGGSHSSWDNTLYSNTLLSQISKKRNKKRRDEMDTLQLVKESIEQREISKASNSLVEKLGNLYEATQRMGFKADVLKKLTEAGFYIILKPDFLKVFRYHAFIGRDQNTVRCCSGHTFRSLIRSFEPVEFIGEIPDYVTKRVIEARYCGLEYFTVHSMQSMPVTPYAKVDPLVVGWCENPYIRSWDYRAYPNDEFRQRLTIGTLTYPILIAIWDYDREMEAF